MRVDVLTREYPPEVYGGAGVHVAELVRAMRARGDMNVRVRCFGAPRDEQWTRAYPTPGELRHANPALQALGTDVALAEACGGAGVVHSHTWYASMAGHLAGLLYGMPHVMTAHSLEPLRPWKAEQLGGGYVISSWAERTAIEAASAVVAVSAAMRGDLLRAYPQVDPHRVKVIYNGIDTDDWQRRSEPDRVRRLGVDPDAPSVLFVGRITHQKGLTYLLRAAASLPPEVQLVVCAGAPDTPEIAAEVESLVTGLRAQRQGVVLIERMLPRLDVVALMSAATVFACPSVYEPLGIVNLEAMACETAVVATATGGIPEVVADGSTGRLVPIEQASDGSGTPVDAERFVADLAAALNDVVANPAAAADMGRAGRERAVSHFSWSGIAQETYDLYASLAHP